MNIVHAWVTTVRREGGTTVTGAAKQLAKELVKVSEKETATSASGYA